jgi:hypothetical protein
LSLGSIKAFIDSRRVGTHNRLKSIDFFAVASAYPAWYTPPREWRASLAQWLVVLATKEIVDRKNRADSQRTLIKSSRPNVVEAIPSLLDRPIRTGLQTRASSPTSVLANADMRPMIGATRQDAGIVCFEDKYSGRFHIERKETTCEE